MLDVEQVLSNVDLGEEAPSTETTEQTVPESVTSDGQTAQTTDEEQVTDSAKESQGTEQTHGETSGAPAKGPDKPKDTVPLATHLETKHKLRDVQLRLAELEARQMVATAKPTQTTADKSPMEKFIADEGGDAVPTAKVLMDQHQWEQSHQQQQAATQASDAASRSVAIALHSMTDETMGDGLGFESVLLVGNSFLTEGDKLDIRQAGDKAGEVLYQRCLERAIRSGTPQGKLLAGAIKQVRDAKGPVPVKKTVTPTKTKEAPTREQVLESDVFGSSESLNDFFGV